MEQGTILQGRYVIDRVLAKGGMSTVYLAHHKVLAHPLAVKRLNVGDVDPTNGSEQRAEFLREGVLLASLSHPSIVKIVDCFADENGFFLVMMYIDGQTLGHRIQRDGALGLSQGLAWARQICEAVQYLHTCSPPVLYRDLKPDNLMIDQTGRLWLLDMGIARRNAPDDTTGLALKGWGTPHFSPPEQLAGLPTDFRSDVYAYGATLYDMFTGERPPECMKRLLESVPVKPPSHFNPAISPRLDALIIKALELQADNRFQTMAEIAGVLADLEGAPASVKAAVAAETPLLARPGSPLSVKRVSLRDSDEKTPSPAASRTPAGPGREATDDGEQIVLEGPRASTRTDDEGVPTLEPQVSPAGSKAAPPSVALDSLPRPAAPSPAAQGAELPGSRMSPVDLVLSVGCALTLVATLALSPTGPAFALEKGARSLSRLMGGGPMFTLIAVFAPSLVGALVASIFGSARGLLICLFLAFLQMYPLGAGFAGLPDSLGASFGKLFVVASATRAQLALGLRGGAVAGCVVVAAVLAWRAFSGAGDEQRRG
ncbi:MAG: serine/threonine protein kinase [Proteobacteria bacterium]|nr:serine/threonine protein kinase [Pseudomonadota bacterium]